MRFTIFSILFLFISSCSSVSHTPIVNETITTNKIISNKTAACQARDEYKRLQSERENS